MLFVNGRIFRVSGEGSHLFILQHTLHRLFTRKFSKTVLGNTLSLYNISQVVSPTNQKQWQGS